jgi:PIN domain nuclease of toxin-antitoxin system
MRLLLDTLSFLWLIHNDRRLGPISRGLIQRQADLVLLSAASLWQLAQPAPGGTPTLTATQALHWAEASGLQLLPIHTTHLLALEQLPPQHQPVDRLLLAQAIHTPLTLMSPKASLRGQGCWVVDPRR